MAGMRITKVTHEFQALTPTESGMTFGQLVDEHIMQKLAAGEIIREVVIEWDEVEWQGMLAGFRSDGRPIGKSSKKAY